MRIKLDRTVCDGFGMCAVHAPDLYSMDEWGYASLHGSGEIAPEDEEGAQRSLLDCPVHAITELTSAGRASADHSDLASTRDSSG